MVFFKKSESKMKSYDGAIGKFEYDPKEFKLAGGKHYAMLLYVGKETDGSKIKIPEGIKDCSRMFEYTDITVPPVIPDGVEVVDRMFEGTFIKTRPVFPESVKSSDDVFKGCTYLEEEKEAEDPEKE